KLEEEPTPGAEAVAAEGVAPAEGEEAAAAAAEAGDAAKAAPGKEAAPAKAPAGREAAKPGSDKGKKYARHGSQAPRSTRPMKLLVGLGNPGSAHAHQRHNVGFMAAERIALRYGLGPWKKRFHGLVCDGQIGGHRVTLLKPQTYMNDSGRSVG